MRCAMVVFLLATVTPAFGQRFLVISRGQATGSSIQSHDFQIGTSAVGAATVSPILDGAVATLVSPERVLRDQMMPAEGIVGIGKRAAAKDPTSTSGPAASIMVVHPDNTQFWVASDGGPWNLIEPEGCVSIVYDESPNGQLGLVFCDTGSNGNLLLAGSTPAVSEWGLLIMLLGVVTYATIRIVRDSQRKVAAS